MNNKRPKLRTVSKYDPPYLLNRFPKDFDYRLGKEIVYLLATKGYPKLEGDEWEQIFARAIQGRWKPSNVGLDDVVFEATAWSAKTVKAKTPSTTKKVRLISGRNSPTYSFDTDKITSAKPEIIGEMVLKIWNERVIAVRSKYENLRTVVLLKSDDLLEVAAFEFETILYDFSSYNWVWNSRNNLVAHCKSNNEHCFTWQPHGSQFTIVEEIPEDRLAIRIQQPPPLNPDDVLAALDFDRSWIKRV